MKEITTFPAVFAVFDAVCNSSKHTESCLIPLSQDYIMGLFLHTISTCEFCSVLGQFVGYFASFYSPR